LSARRLPELETLNAELGGRHFCQAADIGDLDTMALAISSITEKFERIDRTVLLAAIYDPMAIADLDLVSVSKIVDVNLTGYQILNRMLPPKRQPSVWLKV